MGRRPEHDRYEPADPNAPALRVYKSRKTLSGVWVGFVALCSVALNMYSVVNHVQELQIATLIFGWGLFAAALALLVALIGSTFRGKKKNYVLVVSLLLAVASALPGLRFM